MKKIISVICAVVLLISSVSVSAFALTKSEADENIAAQKSLYEGAFAQNITAGEARKVLLKSAGFSEKGVDSTYFDIDNDGKITAIDARIYLRISAKLDNINNYYGEIVYDYFLALINSIKPGAPKYYSSIIDETKKINYKDPDDVVGQINKSVRGLGNAIDALKILFPNENFDDMDLEETKNFDFAKTIKESEGKKNYSGNLSTTKKITDDNYPVIGNELACLLAYNEIKSVKYEKNQEYKFEKFSNVTGKASYTDSVEGLDAITVYLKDESVSLSGDLSGRFNNLTVNKAFDALTEAEVKEMLKDNSFTGDLGGMDDMKDLGTFEMNVAPKTLQYKDAYIKIYFYPETGIPVGTVHNLGYSMNIKMAMNIDVSLGLVSIFDVKGTMDIENIMNTQTNIYLYENKSGA